LGHRILLELQMPSPETQRARPWQFASQRTPVLLLWLLLFNTVAVAGLSVVALRGHVAEIEENRRIASQHALAALAARVETALYQSVQAPFLLLRNVPQADLTGERLGRLRTLDPRVSTLLVLNPDFSVATGSPAQVSSEFQFLSAAVKERVLGEALHGMRAHTTLRSFARADASPRMLYAFEPLGDAAELLGANPASETGAWLLLGFDLDALEQSDVRPLLAEFERRYDTRVALLPPDADELDSEVSVSVAHVLPGWRIDIVSDDTDGGGVIALLGPATIAASLGLLLTMVLISVAIVRAVAREHDLVELRNRFVANVSHELKTPLSLIRMYAETLYLRRLRDPEREHDYHRVILAEAEKLSRMIGDVLSFARLREGLAVYRLEEADIGATLRAVVGTYAGEWASRGAQVELELAPDHPPVAHDPQAIRQLVLNLVDNAVKHGGTSCRVDIRLCADADRTLLEVTDNGKGIDPPRLQRIWRALQRGSIVEDAEGSGLGLGLVKQIADAHGAHLLLEEAPEGRGLRAVVSFPGHGGAA
jgi:signal transduction histidine kinase